MRPFIKPKAIFIFPFDQPQEEDVLQHERQNPLEYNQCPLLPPITLV
jgi:hypothetical protein